NTGAWNGSGLADSSGLAERSEGVAAAVVSGIAGSVAVRSHAPRARASAIAEGSSRGRSIGWGSGSVGASRSAIIRRPARGRAVQQVTPGSAVGAGAAPDQLAAAVHLVHGDGGARVADAGQRRVVGLHQAAGPG